MSETVYNFAKNFTITPGPRERRQGAKSGEAFRDIVLKLLSEHDHVTIDLNGVEGFGSSFLDEAFVKLVRQEGFSPSDLRRRLTFVWDDQLELRKLWSWIDAARPGVAAAQ